MEIHRDKNGKLWLTQGKYARKVSRYMSNPEKMDWEAVKCTLKYLKDTMNYGLLFDAKSLNAKSLIDYVDADYGQDLDGRKSTTGYGFTLGDECISWMSTLLKCVAQSTIDGKYVAAAEAAKEAIWLDMLVAEMRLSHDIVNLHCNSQSALYLAVNQIMNSRVKHIDIRYHFIKETVFYKKIELVKIDNKLNRADAFYKSNSFEEFWETLFDITDCGYRTKVKYLDIT
ncbi:hypothetical protein AXG93_1112s1410 [Marchantia polymorpha subsp. ruderalis]|uniref:Reverse transcriptase Ty1/copia-type domain-containing protein n=1 Tax=Marchantia polymorpha subsp. ruderalis TaxID=1480154 RepID=A0A176WBV1_MARPO|nr:hypothetical protein AXG93_1112s1410 [Marchantia polymorpha subsp. ruderalis]